MDEKTKAYLLKNVQWLVDNGLEVPQDIVDGLLANGISVNIPTIKDKITDIQEDIDNIKNVVMKPKPQPPPVVNIDLEPISAKLTEIVTSLAKPAPDINIQVPTQKAPDIKVNVPEQKQPEINIQMPRVKKAVQRIKRDPKTKEILFTETTYEYE